MKTSKLIEMYGRRFTPSVKLAGFIAILIFGILLAFNGGNSVQTSETNTTVEQPISE